MSFKCDPLATLPAALEALADPDSPSQYGADRIYPAAALLRDLADWIDGGGFSPVTFAAISPQDPRRLLVDLVGVAVPPDFDDGRRQGRVDPGGGS